MASNAASRCEGRVDFYNKARRKRGGRIEMSRVLKCAEYAAEWPQHFPAENHYGDVMDATEFSACCGSMEVTDAYHMYLPPQPRVHPRFDNVRTFLWTSEHGST